MSNQVIPIILCGGSGKRLWPFSRKNRPKPLLKLEGTNSLLCNTIARAIECTGCPAENIILATTEHLKETITRDVRRYNVKATQHIIGEPLAKNTAAAIAYAGGYAARTFGQNELLWFIPSDHIIHDRAALKRALERAKVLASEGYITTFGIQPDYPETGYGYIEKGETLPNGDYAIKHFHEKPDVITAKQYLKANDYLWNSGMFMFRARTIERAFQTLAPEYSPLFDGDINAYTTVHSEPFDKIIMERTNNAAVIECAPGWSDIGTWRALMRYHLHSSNQQEILRKA